MQTHKSQQFRNVLQNPVGPGPIFTWLLRAAHSWFNQVKSLLGVKTSLLRFTQFTQACPPMFRQFDGVLIRSSWSELVRKHNDPAIDYHVPLYEYVVIGYELIAAPDVMRINLSSVWMLANALCAILAGWNFQLCADVTGNFCNRCVDLLEFSVSSIPCQNNVLCLSIIPKAIESEKVYKLIYDDLRTAVNYLCIVRPCMNAYCECCPDSRIAGREEHCRIHCE
jgi:hypothetical protein